MALTGRSHGRRERESPSTASCPPLFLSGCILEKVAKTKKLAILNKIGRAHERSAQHGVCRLIAQSAVRSNLLRWQFPAWAWHVLGRVLRIEELLLLLIGGPVPG